MDYSTGLRQIHQILSGLFIASASDGKIVDSLDYLINLRRISDSEIASLSVDAKDFLMCKFTNALTGSVEWCVYRYKNLMMGECGDYALSGLSAFPLPVWPFFGNSNPDLNVFTHFVEYLSAYHPCLMLEKPSKDSIRAIDGDNNMFVSFDKGNCCLFSAVSFKDSILQVSFYMKGMGAFVVDAGDIKSLPYSIKLFQQLDPLQYEGNVCCFQFNKSTVKYSFSSLCFLENDGEARRVAEKLFDCVIESVDTDLSLFDPEAFFSSVLSMA